MGHLCLILQPLTNIGNPGGILQSSNDISFIRLCDGIKAIVANAGTNTIAQLNFSDILSSSPTGISLGNTGGFSFPHSISQLFRVDNDIYALIPNASNNTLSRIRFQGCQTIPGSSLQTPGPVTYDQPGTYYISLVADIGLPTQGSFCKQIVVRDCNSPGISNVINDYTPVIAFSLCKNLLTVENATKYNVGDTVLMIQMKGAVIDSSNTLSFGNVTNYKNAGNYEFNYVKNKTGNIIELKNQVTRQYDFPDGKVQLIRVPYYISTNVSSTLTCLPWDGSKGGVLVFNVKDTLTLHANIDVSGKGFRGANIINPKNNSFYCHESSFYYPEDLIKAAPKGEGISEVSASKSYGRGALANGGGGGCEHNSGGGGGSNGSIGGVGGNEWTQCTPAPSVNGGIGGKALAYSNIAGKVFMGGGGGAGHCDNIPGFDPNGGNGGAIILINAAVLKNSNYAIKNNGDNAVECIRNNQQYKCHEGMGGGGGGGSTLLKISLYFGNTSLELNGGKGADMNGEILGRLGPGGGGSGGVTWLASSSLPPNVIITNTGGLNGINIDFGNDNYGSAPGLRGINMLNLIMPVDSILFKSNIDSVRIKDSATICRNFNFTGLGYTNTSAINTWDWNFGDGNYTHTQNTSHIYPGTGPYIVHLLVTDINGCKDSITKTVIPMVAIADAGVDTAFCSNSTVTHVLHGNTNGSGYTWAPAGFLNNNTLQNPTATVSTTTTFYLTIPGLVGCTVIDSVKIVVNAVPFVSTLNNFSICKMDSMLLATTSNANTFQWTPASVVSNPNIANPYFIDTTSQQIIVTGINSTGCFAKDTVNILVKLIPTIQTIRDTALCGQHNVTLTATGGQSYSWSPAINLSNPVIANPVFTGTATQTYIVTGIGLNACKAKDTVTIIVNDLPVLNITPYMQVCRGDVLQLSGNSTAQNNYWSPYLSVTNANILNPYFTDTVSQTMTLMGTNSSTGCTSSTSMSVTVKTRPVVKTIEDFSSCSTNTVTLFTNGAQSYNWSPSAGLNNTITANPIFTGVGTHTYVVTGTSANGCTSKDTVNIMIAQKPVFVSPVDKAICAHSSVQLDGNNGNTYQYTWSPATHLSNNSILNPIASPTITTTYHVVVSDHLCNYDSSFNLIVSVNPLPTIHASRSNDLSCSVGASQLIATGALNYNWSPTTGLTNPVIYNPVASPNSTIIYTVTGMDEKGCTNSDTVRLLVKGGIYNGFRIPNSFTPNGDNLNDCFGVPEWGETRNFLLIIYSRWGQKVFEATSVTDCWDGNYKGRSAEAGNYVYYLKAETLCGNINTKGNLLLIR